MSAVSGSGVASFVTTGDTGHGLVAEEAPPTTSAHPDPRPRPMSRCRRLFTRCRAANPAKVVAADSDEAQVVRAAPGVGTSTQGAAPSACAQENTFSVAMTAATDELLRGRLVRADRQEDLTFALYETSTGATRTTALIVDVVLPDEGERMVHGNASFTGAYFLRAAGIAAERNLGLAFLHSHPGGRGWQGLSKDDRAAESGHAAATEVITGRPLVGLTLATKDASYSARRWRRRAIVGPTSTSTSGKSAVWEDEQATTVRIVGEQIRACFNNNLVPVPPATPRTLRTVQSWGRPAHSDLIRLRIGVIGAGSVAQLVAETLVRTGCVHVDVIDFDLVEEHNLDRLLHASEADIGNFKVEVLVEELRRRTVTPGAEVHGFTDSVVEPQGWLRALDCDVLFSCVDRPWPRFALNVAAYGHFIPVVDGGVAVDARAKNAPANGAGHGSSDGDQTPKDVRLLGAEWRAHVVGPERKCLECLGQYDPGDVGMERAGRLDDPTYIASLPADHRLRRGENVFAFSMACASAEVLELLRAVLGPSGIHDVGATLTHWTTATTDRDIEGCSHGCLFPTDVLGRGDALAVDVTGAHPIEQHARRVKQPQDVPPARRVESKM